MNIIIALLISYLLGSVPVGYIICRILRGIDIRTKGSGNIGATNVARVVGKKAGIVTLILDILKGLTAVVLIPKLIGGHTDLSNPCVQGLDLIKITCAFGVVCGHNWTVFLKFRGGKGVAATAGAIMGLMPIVFLSSFCIWCIVFVIWRYVSLASIIAAVFLPIFLILYREPLIYQILSIIIAIIGIVRHKENIKRLLSGKEKRFTPLETK